MAMEKLISCLILLALTAFSGGHADQGKESWAKKLRKGHQAVTTLQFYFHDKLSGSSPSAVRIVEPTSASKSPTRFGVVMMADDPLTIGPDPKSTEVGRARGLYGSAGQKDLGLIMAMSYSFTHGEYNGSSFSLLSINHAMNPVRELAVVGGTGQFRLARGYALAHTHSLDVPTGDAIIGYNVTLITNN
ncbi:unnamed protein product [Cuscuta europaea]|uniref:Dirigent protein n=1 Tax=Cuscuta europaea TaxID=41803 RepID=A0A9P1DXN4_CUSEU|nr:unnamed protein product [Cuscuta europaea]